MTTTTTASTTAIAHGFYPKIRKSYSFSQKLAVIELYEKCLNFSGVSKLTGIDRKCIRDWVKRKDDFRQVDPNGCVSQQQPQQLSNTQQQQQQQQEKTPCHQPSTSSRSKWRSKSVPQQQQQQQQRKSSGLLANTSYRSNRTFPIEYKLQIVEMYEKCGNFTLLSRSTGIDRKCIRDWVSKKSRLIEQKYRQTGLNYNEQEQVSTHVDGQQLVNQDTTNGPMDETDDDQWPSQLA